MAELQKLPLGIQDFEMLRNGNKLYVDKTALLMDLPDSIPRCFLSRPRRFGKSLTLSTLDAMFSGRAELFKGLAAEEWVKEKAGHPTPVLRFDMSSLTAGEGVEVFRSSLLKKLKNAGKNFGMILEDGTPGDLVGELIEGVAKKSGSVAVLIDEYDKPILNNIDNVEKANAIREALSSFYTVLKSCDAHIEFLMLTGISKFSKMSIFSAMNNLIDISMDRGWGALTGYTQEELERDLGGWIDYAAAEMNMDRAAMLERLKLYYDGFSFNGREKVYNPFSVMQCLQKAEFGEYWYDSGSPSFIVKYLKNHNVESPEKFRHIQVNKSFTGAQEIENARPESFLFQSGYLTIEKREENTLTLDYPNTEVMNALAKTYLESIYKFSGYTPLGDQLWKAMRDGDLDGMMKLYNEALSGLAGLLQSASRPTEAYYNSLFLIFLRGAGITCGGEIPNNQGRCDVLVLFPDRVVILEFKLAQKESDWEKLLEEGRRQIVERGYMEPWASSGKSITAAAVVIDAGTRRAVLWG